jgi:hypothetical protein
MSVFVWIFGYYRVEGSALNCTGFLAALEEAYEMEAYIIGRDCCRLTRQSVCPWQHYKAMLTDSTECMFLMPPSSAD